MIIYMYIIYVYTDQFASKHSSRNINNSNAEATCTQLLQMTVEFDRGRSHQRGLGTQTSGGQLDSITCLGPKSLLVRIHSEQDVQ